ncbi:MAG: hypothetical protein QG673_814 [Pseudomonadota bacterium]|nr:hypothetical protein [Pseudomonadota bacterium]
MVDINTKYLKTIISPNCGNSGKTKSEALDGRDLFNELAHYCNSDVITKDMAKVLLNSLESLEPGKTIDQFYSEISSSNAKNQDLSSKYNVLNDRQKAGLKNLSKQWLNQKENFRPSLFCLNTTKSYMAAIDLLKLVANGRVNQSVSRYGTSFSGGLRVYRTTYTPVNRVLQEDGHIKLSVDGRQGERHTGIRNKQDISGYGKVKLDNATYRGNVDKIKNILAKLSLSALGDSLKDSVQELIAVLHREGDLYSLEGITLDEVKTAKHDFVSCLLSTIKRNIEENNQPLSQEITKLEGELKVLNEPNPTGSEPTDSDFDDFANNSLHKGSEPTGSDIDDFVNSILHKLSEVEVAKDKILKQNKLNYSCLEFIYMIAIADNKSKLDDYNHNSKRLSTDDMLSTIKTECNDNTSIISLVATLERYKEFICQR